MFQFPVSGIEIYWWLPSIVSFGISSFTSIAGVSGAFLLLPFQMSVLGFTGPAVSPTNMIFNIVAIPSGVYRFVREKRMVWPITWVIILGTLPGVFIGAILRIQFLPDPKSFKLFVGFVLLYVGARLVQNVIRKSATAKAKKSAHFQVKPIKFTWKTIAYEFNQKEYSVSSRGIFFLSFIVGIIGGTYGIGGGAIIAPFLVTVFALPLHTIAGAALMGTFITSVAGVIFYTGIAPFYSSSGLIIQPDWLLGLMFGIGGAAGIYLGARIQRFISERIIKIILSLLILFVALKYIIGFWI